MSKSAPTRNGGQLSFPAISIGGHLSVYVGDRLVRGVWRRAPSGEQASRPTSESGQQLFAILFQLFRKAAEMRGMATRFTGALLDRPAHPAGENRQGPIQNPQNRVANPVSRAIPLNHCLADTC